MVRAGTIKIKNEDGSERDETRGELLDRATRLYLVNDEIETDQNLCLFNGAPPCQPKFERLDDAEAELLKQRPGESLDDFLERVQAAREEADEGLGDKSSEPNVGIGNKSSDPDEDTQETPNTDTRQPRPKLKRGVTV